MAEKTTPPDPKDTTKPAAARAPSLDTLVQQQYGEVEEAKKATSSLTEKAIRSYDDVEKEYRSLQGQFDKLQDNVSNIKPFEPPKQKDPAAVFGSFAGILSTIASFTTATPLITSINALAAGMKARKEGNDEEYQRQFDSWKTNTDFAFKMADYQNTAYEERLAMAKTHHDMAMSEISTLSALFNDPAAKTAMEIQGVEGVARLNMERQRNAIEAAKAKAEIEKNHMAIKAMQGGALSEQDMRDMADQYLAGDKSVLQGLGYGNTGAQNRLKLRHYIQEEARAKGMSPGDIAQRLAEYSGMTAAERSVGTRMATVELAVSELNRVLPLAITSSREVSRSKIVPWNTMQQAIQRGTSDPRLAKFTAANNTLINVYARAISPTGVPTVADKDHAREMLSTQPSQEAYEATVIQMKAEAEAAEKAPGDVKRSLRSLYQDSPSSEKGPDKSRIFSPDSEQDYNLLPTGTHYRMPNDPPGSWRVKQ